ncbi:MAG: osmoprotectant transport system permease protein [Pseudonocardiales bacterium]|nr:osmoprotectant transport system permease protein [Pseudonocardiales bacterium]
MGDAWNYFFDHRDEIQDWTGTTLWLAVLPVAIGLVLSLPVGWLAYRYRWSYPPIISGAGLLYTIPSLVLFVSLPGLLGTKILDPINVAVALTIYTFALLVRIVADGLLSVAPATLDAAAAMGYTTFQRLVKVQLPIAVPVIGAGLRVAAVSNVSLISVASAIGVTQLGNLFVEGFRQGRTPPTIVGLVLFIVIAVVFDAAILIGIRLLTPWRRAVAAR